jgi:hypothetical protein
VVDDNITIGGVRYPAVRCEHCGTLVYPSASLKDHQLRHELRRIRFEKVRDELVETFRRLRGNFGTMLPSSDTKELRSRKKRRRWNW